MRAIYWYFSLGKGGKVVGEGVVHRAHLGVAHAHRSRGFQLDEIGRKGVERVVWVETPPPKFGAHVRASY